MIRREYLIYRRLSGVAGVPACYGLLDGQYLVLEYVEGMALSEVGQQLDDSEIFFARLLGIIQSMHEAGVAHADLKRRKNVLVTTDGQPCVIDFGTAVVTSEPDRWLNRRCFDLVKRFDYNAWIKLKYRRNYESITPADQPYYQPTLIEGLMRVIRRIWGTITFRQLRKARRRARESRSGSSG
jgi:RIO-like serine/threonine protein kinase